MKELFFLITFVFLSAIFAICALIASYICSVHAPDDDKEQIYECGMPILSDAKIMFNFRYINFAILFLIFDVETIFLFPFAVNYCILDSFAIVEATIFICLLLLALFYAIKTKLVG